jgi:hypothetical protein
MKLEIDAAQRFDRPEAFAQALDLEDGSRCAPVIASGGHLSPRRFMPRSLNQIRFIMDKTP